ncbi:protein JOKA2 isoform X2 [Amaranthus tricolor]|uniref:protein JOKA2 isoform X2 n=1 Tax=Amaranthus tricolor TaxID=29722 RepID=UPI002584C71F|nr:protein JOKA2 isoform X2 [Amaranthus tricolor]
MVVFKVKYEDTLRRFNVRVFSTEDRAVLEKRMDLNMEGLRLKICSLFNLPSTTCFNLTYIDEDDDLVTLVDDEDLHDVLSQCLNPVRITVCMKTDKPIAASAEQSTPKVSSDPNYLNVTEVLKTVPVPLRHAFSKISSDLTEKAASTSPILGDLLDGLSKVGQSYLNASPSDGSTTPEKKSQSKKVDASMDRGVKHNDSQTSNIAQLSPKNNESTGKAEFIPSYRQWLMHRGEDVNLDEFEKNKYNLKLMEDNTNVDRNSGADGHVTNCSKNSLKKCVSSENVTSKSAHGVNKSSHFDGGSLSRPCFDLKSVGECPFSGELPTFPPFPCEPIYPNQTPVRTSNGIFQTSLGPNFHKGVRCDGCGVHPITGPRFKSKVKHDYDLCRICFEQMGNDLEYFRIDFPLPYRHPCTKDFCDPGSTFFRIPHVQQPRTLRRHAGKYPRFRFDSHFIMDVNVMDGTVMAPLTPFTKIWRLRNNGTLSWNRGLRFLWIDGDRFSASDSVEIEIPVDGVSVGKEIDIAVDFVAPELPGKYISYWRMADHSGQLFGQRVWVLIQVDESADLTLERIGRNLNLLQSESFGAVGAELNLDSPVPIGPPTAEQRPKTEIDLNFPFEMVSSHAADNMTTASGAAPAASSSALPNIDADNAVTHKASSVCNVDVKVNESHESPYAPPSIRIFSSIDTSDTSSACSSTIMNNKSCDLEQDTGKNDIETTLLKELDQMGFKDNDLNKTVLRVNGYDMQRSLDALFGVSEWDPMLKELEEMGFEDRVTNHKLLTKNNGSITRVVMDLIAGELP